MVSEAQNRRLQFLLTVNDDQMLYNFKVAAGLDTKGAPEMIGWDSPESKLRGHTTGHYLSALAKGYQVTGNQQIAKKINYMVNELKKVQEAFEKMPEIHEGFLSAYDESQFDLLEQYKTYPEIWAPYYTLHKIMAGLLDIYHLTGNDKSLEIISKIGDWVYQRLNKLNYVVRQRMWRMYIAGEFGGMNESLADLYSFTHDSKHLAAAKFFDNDLLFFPMVQQKDVLGGLHANQHIPQIVGAMRLYEVSNEAKYYQIANFFWNTVINHHTYAMGGTGDGELFQKPDQIANHLTKNTAEHCASYNMLKLTNELYKYNPSNKYINYYENVIFNHILATPDRKEQGETTYFMSTEPGAQRFFEVENSCCHGTGMEVHFDYATMEASFDEKNLHLNYYLPSQILDDKNHFNITIKWLKDDMTAVSVEVRDTGGKILCSRKPDWAAQVHFEIDGILSDLENVDSYYTVPTSVKK